MLSDNRRNVPRFYWYKVGIKRKLLFVDFIYYLLQKLLTLKIVSEITIFKITMHQDPFYHLELKCLTINCQVLYILYLNLYKYECCIVMKYNNYQQLSYHFSNCFLSCTCGLD